MRKQAAIIAAVVFIPIFIMIGAGCDPQTSKEVTVGSKNFTEQYIVGELMKQLLEDRGFTVKLASGHSSITLREGMEAGDIDICADYTGTAWMVLLAHEYVPGMDNNKVYMLVKEEEKTNGFIWLNPIWNNNTYALASWREFVEEHSLRTISDLASFYRENYGYIKTYIGLEFYSRPDGLPALEGHYDFEIDESALLIETPGASLQGLEEHVSDVAMVFGTDAAIDHYDWYLYLDDKTFFPPYDLTPYVRKDVLEKYPDIADILNELSGTFPGAGELANPDIVAECQKAWQELNAKVAINKTDASIVAREYLVENDLIEE